MTTTTGHTTAVPQAIHLAVTAWLIAITAGVAEALIRTRLPGPPTAVQLAVRFAIYAGLAVLALALRAGRNAVRYALALILGGLGTVSLLSGPIGWLLAGGSPTTYLATATSWTLLLIAVRLLHLAAVALGTGAMFQPAANAFFRARAGRAG